MPKPGKVTTDTGTAQLQMKAAVINLNSIMTGDVHTQEAFRDRIQRMRDEGLRLHRFGDRVLELLDQGIGGPEGKKS